MKRVMIRRNRGLESSSIFLNSEPNLASVQTREERFSMHLPRLLKSGLPSQIHLRPVIQENRIGFAYHLGTVMRDCSLLCF